MRIATQAGRTAQPGSQGGGLRRARRRSRVDPLLPPRRPGLRLVFAVPSAGRSPGSRAGRPRTASASSSASWPASCACCTKRELLEALVQLYRRRPVERRASLAEVEPMRVRQLLGDEPRHSRGSSSRRNAAHATSAAVPAAYASRKGTVTRGAPRRPRCRSGATQFGDRPRLAVGDDEGAAAQKTHPVTAAIASTALSTKVVSISEHPEPTRASRPDLARSMIRPRAGCRPAPRRHVAARPTRCPPGRVQRQLLRKRFGTRVLPARMLRSQVRCRGRLSSPRCGRPRGTRCGRPGRRPLEPAAMLRVPCTFVRTGPPASRSPKRARCTTASGAVRKQQPRRPRSRRRPALRSRDRNRCSVRLVGDA